MAIQKNLNFSNFTKKFISFSIDGVSNLNNSNLVIIIIIIDLMMNKKGKQSQFK